MASSNVRDQRANRTRLRKLPTLSHRWHCDHADIFSVYLELGDCAGWKNCVERKKSVLEK